MAKLPLKSREDMSAEQQPVYDYISASRGSMPNLFRVLLNSPGVTQNVSRLGSYLRYESTLEPMIREIVILTASRELGCDYEWAQHEPKARNVGVRVEVIEAIRNGRAPMGLPAKEGIFAQAAKELVHNFTLSEPTFQGINHLLRPEQTVDLIVLVGYYAMMARVLLALDVEIDEGLTSPQFGA